ncbi:MAG: protein arginine kinase [Phycisphaerales bacterium]
MTHPDSDVVMSCRVRLARNLAAFPFVNRASHQQRREVVETVRAAPVNASVSGGAGWIDIPQLDASARQLLVERHLVSRQFAEGDSPRALAVTPCETLSIMVNEEDHLRIQAMRQGSALKEAFQTAMAVDDALSASLDFAFCPTLGYLTACPTNVGCGIRLSVMVHLRALRQTNEIERVKRAAKDLHLAVRGFYGEGSDAIGDWFQISNQRTLGVRETDLLEDFVGRIVPTVVAYEREARRAMLERSRRVVEDRVFRGVAALRAARMLGLDETMKLLSSVRLGVCVGLVQGVELETLNRLTIAIQPAHLRVNFPGIQTEDDEREARARATRTCLGDWRP